MHFLAYRFFSASSRLIKSSRLGGLGTPAAMSSDAGRVGCVLSTAWGFGSVDFRRGTVLGGNLMWGCKFSLVGLGGAMVTGSRRVLSPVESSASKGGSSDAIPPPSLSDPFSISESTPQSTLYVRAISRRYLFTRSLEGGSTPSLLKTRGETLLSELSVATWPN